jgi:hypothetical protein
MGVKYDIIHADADLAELGYVDEIDQFDAEISQETDIQIENNSFSLTVPDIYWERSPIMSGHHIYVPGTEFGGKVELIRHSTALQQITVSGVTWRGELYRKIIEPPPGEAYKVVNGEANAKIAELIGATLGANVTVSGDNSGITVNRRFRYTNLLIGIYLMLSEQGAALDVQYDQVLKRVVLSTAAVTDYSETIDLSQDYGVNMVATMGGYDRYNHIIALGAGELLDRDILHVYRNDNGSLTTVPPAWVGTAADHVAVYDYTNPETVAELQKGAEKRLLEIIPLRQLEIDPQVSGLDLKLGDIVGARDRLTGMAGTATVVGKILTMNSSGIKLETRVK